MGTSHLDPSVAKVDNLAWFLSLYRLNVEKPKNNEELFEDLKVSETHYVFRLLAGFSCMCNTELYV